MEDEVGRIGRVLGDRLIAQDGMALYLLAMGVKDHF